MHSINSAMISSQISGQQREAHEPRILKTSLKLTLKPKQVSKPKNESSLSSNPQKSSRLLGSTVNIQKQQSRLKLKNDIDNRLHRVYSSLVKHKSIQLTTRRNDKRQEQEGLMPFASSTQGESSQGVFNELPYQLLGKYIKSIYEEYQIRDPLDIGNKLVPIDKEQNQFSQTQSISIKHATPRRTNNVSTSQKNQSKTKKKVLILKDHFISQLKTHGKTEKKTLKLETPKKTMTENAQQSKSQKSRYKSNGLSCKKKLEMTLKMIDQEQNQEQNIETNLAGKYRNETLAQTKFSISDVNAMNQNSWYQQMNESIANSKVYFSRKNHNPGMISQNFRYCFICEESILQANITYHERVCKGLNDILSTPNLDKDQLLQLMSSKIQKVQKQLEYMVSSQQFNETSQKLSQINSKVLGWISSISKQQKQGVSYQNRSSLQEHKQISQMIERTKLLRKFDTINKLNWFIHLKKNFLIKVGSGLQ